MHVTTSRTEEKEQVIDPYGRLWVLMQLHNLTHAQSLDETKQGSLLSFFSLSTLYHDTTHDPRLVHLITEMMGWDGKACANLKSQT